MTNATATGTIRLQSDTSSLTSGVAKSSQALQNMDAVLRRSGPALGDMSKAAKAASLGTDLLTSGILGAVKGFGPWGLVIGVAADALIGYVAQTEAAAKRTKEFWNEVRAGIKLAGKTIDDINKLAHYNELNAEQIDRATGATDDKIRAMEVEIARTKGLGHETHELEKQVSALRVESLLAQHELDMYLETASQASVRRAKLLAEAKEIEREQELKDAEHDGKMEKEGVTTIVVKKRSGGAKKKEEKADNGFADRFARAEWEKLMDARDEQRKAKEEQDALDFQTMDEKFDIIMQQRQDAAEAAKEAAHERELQRIEEEKRAREEQLAQIEHITTAASGHAQNIVAGIMSVNDARNNARRAALAQGKTEAQVAQAVKQAELQAKAARMQSLRDMMAAQAVQQFFLGIGALATTWGVPNPAAILHFAAAAGLGAGAAIAGARSNALSDQSSGMDSSGGGSPFGGASGRGSGGGTGGGTNRGGSLPTGSGNAIPGSPVPQPTSQAQSGGGTTTYLVIQGNLINDKQNIDHIAKRLQEREHSKPRRAS